MRRLFSPGNLVRVFPWVLVLIVITLTLPGTIKRYSPEGRREEAASKAFTACYEEFYGVDQGRFTECLSTTVAPKMFPNER